MTMTEIQSAISQGYAITGQILGCTYNIYRPNGVSAALAPENLINTVSASFVQNGNYSKPGKVGNPEWYGYYDDTNTLPGDYLSNGMLTYFIAAQQPLLPYLTIKCERVVSISQAMMSNVGGVQGYGGDVGSNDKALLTRWPASIIQGSRGERGDVTLPEDVRDPNWIIRLPLTPGANFDESDAIIDDLLRRYIISSAEPSEYGWRIVARQAEA